MPPISCEFRYITTRVELRADGDGPRRLQGHAAVFDTDSAIGPADDPYYIERIAPGAFRTAIAEDDVRALFNHDPNLVLGRNRAGTLRLAEDAVGLAVEVIPPDTPTAREVLTLIERGDISQMSFGFTVRTGGQLWEELPDGTIRRTLRNLKLWDVSPVTFAQYPETDVAVREARAAGLVAAHEEARAALRARAQRNRNRLALAERGL